METLFKNYFWVLTLAVLSITGYLTAQTVNEVLSDSLFPEDYSAQAPKEKRGGADESYSPRRGIGQEYASLLVERNVFDADRSNPPEPEEEPEKVEPDDAEDNKPDGELPDSELDIKLVGTLVHEDPEQSLATIQHSGSGKLIRVGSDLKRNKDDESSLAKVLEIHRRYILLLEAGEHRRVRLWGEAKVDDKRPPPPGLDRTRKPAMPERVAEATTDYSKFVRKKSMYQYEIDRNMLESQLNDLTELGRQARIVPNYRNGQYQGFKLIGVRPGSLYRALGIRSGDVIQRVNGQDIDSPNKAMMLFEELRTNKQIGLDIERRGQKRTLQYDIK